MKLIDLTNSRFGKLVAVEKTKLGHHTAYRCKCDCGNETTVRSQSLRRGESMSCGCMRAEKMRAEKTTHGRYGSGTYNSWRSMLARCMDQKHKQFKDYGGRGITVCQAWQDSFESFLAEIGERPNGTTLDRIDNDGHYAAGNCRWATRTEQNRNKRQNHRSTK